VDQLGSTRQLNHSAKGDYKLIKQFKLITRQLRACKMK